MSDHDQPQPLSAWSNDEILSYLQRIGDEDEARYFVPEAGGQAFGLRRPWQCAGMILGFIPRGSTDRDVYSIATVQADRTLINQRIKITLDKVHIAHYPGFGEHEVLCEFTGKNQVAGETEELAFALRFFARDNSSPGISGIPIFMGLTVSPDGISFKGKTVNVKSSGDEMVLNILDTPAFTTGLTLLHTAQPALKPLTSLATATVKAIAKRDENAVVQQFDLGLDFDGSATSARLSYGSYIVVQSDEGNSWDWADYEWNANGMALHPKGKPQESPHFNYMVFAVSPFSPAAP